MKIHLIKADIQNNHTVFDTSDQLYESMSKSPMEYKLGMENIWREVFCDSETRSKGAVGLHYIAFWPHYKS